MAAIHGNEINGTDIVRRAIIEIQADAHRLRGTLIAIPVVNIPGFLNQTRYLPYNRDLNRFFPGSKRGNNAERMAFRLFREIVEKCDFGIDLHTAAEGRQNLPHVRGDMSHPEVRQLARAFGAAVVLDEPGVRGSLRRESTANGIPTILFEAGETGKFSKGISQQGLRGVLNVLAELKMWGDSRERPPFQVIVKSSDWVRAEKGGILDLHVKPGDLIYKGDLVGLILNPFGRTVTEIRTPATGIVIGVTTAPLAIPGTGLVHLAKLKKSLAMVERSIKKASGRRSLRRGGKPRRATIGVGKRKGARQS
jgi:predicted deacylase